ncbi:MAG: GAF domain-containing protein [Candidatus Sericytochromatia bacterium]|nr:GAF domain-containing protein [Candidatus Sericytochromatia bacterium]
MLQLPSRYEHRRLLGQGGMGEVHLVRDRERGEELALKTLRLDPQASAAVRDEARFLFRQEFGAMATLRHPNLVAAHDFGHLADDTPYFTMDAVPGHDLAGALPAGEAEVRAWLPGIVAALGYLHARGFVHGDVKPENIRLGDDGRPRLMDLGLLARAGQAGTAIRGSLHYLAPECARGSAIDARADLYGLGAVLYHALTGQPPFDAGPGQAPVALLRAHLDAPPEPIGARVPGLSPALAGAVMRLLAKEPQARFSSGWELLAALGLEGSVAQEACLLSPPLVARGTVLEELHRALEGQQGSLTQLVGPDGVGKSRLLAAWRAAVQLQGESTFHARGLGVEAPPYQALRPWLQALVATPGPELERLGPVLVRLLPELGVEPAPLLDGAQERVRLHTAVTELALAVAPRAVWLLDDADALDPASRELVGALRSRGGGRAWHWVLGCKEPVEAGGRSLVLPPLSEAETAELAGGMLGQASIPPPLLERLVALAGGLPGPTEALLTHWVRAGALVRAATGWVPAEGASLDLPGGLAVVLDGSFSALGAHARHVGLAAAVLGPSGPLAALASVAGLDDATFFGALTELEAADTLQRDGGGYRFVRPLQAEALAATVPEATGVSWHSVAATWWEDRLGPQPEAASLGDAMALARHHLAGATPPRAVPWVRAAASRAHGLHALPSLLPLLERTVALPDLAPADRADLQAYRTSGLRFAGRVDEALALHEAEVLGPARAGLGGRLAEHLCTLGVLCQMKGRYAEALTAYGEAIDLAAAAGDAGTTVRAHVFAGRTAFFSGNAEVARAHLRAAIHEARATHTHAMLGAALSLYGYVLAASGAEQIPEALSLLEEAIAVNTALDNTYMLHDACNNLGNVYLMQERFLEARPVFEQCMALCERMAATTERCFALINTAAVGLELGHLKEAQGRALEALEVSRRQGRKFPEAYARALHGQASVHLGDLARAQDQLDQALKLAREIANRYLELGVMARRVEVLLHLGRFEEARQDLASARQLARETQNDEHNARFERCEAVLALRLGLPDAGRLVADMLERARRQGHPAALAHALRWQAEHLLAAGQPDLALGLVTEGAEQAALAGLVLLGAQLRELWGRVLSGLDDGAAAERFAEGRELAGVAGCVITDILCQAGYGRTHPAGRDDRREAPRRLETLLSGLEEQARLAYVSWPEREAVCRPTSAPGDPTGAERFHHLTDLLATITSQPDMPRIMQQALVALVELAGAERGFLLLYNGFEVTQQVFYGMDERDNDEFSSSLAHQVLWSGKPLVVEDVSSHAEFSDKKSVQALSLRSVVAVPLHDGTETLGVMMADSQHINERVGEAELQLAMALARQVAIALSNARRLEQYRNAHAEHEVLNRLAVALLRVDTLEAGFARVAAEAVPLCGVSRAVWLDGPDPGQLRHAFDATGQQLDAREAAISRSTVQWVFEEGQPLHLVDAQDDEAFQHRASVQALGLHTIFAVPIRQGEHVAGVLYLDHPMVVEDNPAAVHTLLRIADLFGAFWSRFERAGLPG